METQTKQLSKRLDRLEKENRILKACGFLLVVLAVIGAVADKGKTLEVDKIKVGEISTEVLNIVNKQGETQGFFEADAQSGSNLRLTAIENKKIIGAVSLSTRNGVPKIDLEDIAKNVGRIRITMQDKNFRGLVIERASAGEKAPLEKNKYFMVPRIRLGMTMKQDSPALVIKDGDDKVRTVVGSVTYQDEKGRKIRNPESSIMLTDKDGRSLWDAP